MLIDYGRTNVFSKAVTISWELRPGTLKVQELLQGDLGDAGMRHLQFEEQLVDWI